jgi:hypothetical protein
VLLAQRGDAERASRSRIPLGPDAEPPKVDEADRDRTRPFGAERLERHVVAHRFAQAGKALGETHEVVELLLLLPRAEFRVVEILAPTRAVDSGRLELGTGPRRDPHIAPGRRDRELLDPLDLLGIRNPLSTRIHVLEVALSTLAAPAAFP